MSDFASWSTEDLLALQTKLETEIADRLLTSGSAVYSVVYDQLREGFKERYSFNQVDALRPWIALPKTKRVKFITSWTRATKAFVALGFSDNPQLSAFVAKLVNRSKVLKDQLSFELILRSLDECLELFDDQFPGYRNGNVLGLLIQKLS